MPRLLLLLPTTTYRAKDFIQAACRLGVEVTVASEEDSSVSGLNPAGFLTLDFRDGRTAVRQVVEYTARHPIDAVVPADDQVTHIAASICEALEIKHSPPEALERSRNKYSMRQALEAGGVASPGHELCRLDAMPTAVPVRIGFPCVVKPLALSGSQGVIRADDQATFQSAVKRTAAIIEAQEDMPESDRGTLLVEEYIPGIEVALEGMLTDGSLAVVALFDKPDPLEGPFFEETIFVTPSRLPDSTRTSIRRCAQDAVNALGLTQGPVHIELRVDRRGPWIIEVNPRSIGGLCSRVLRFGLGVSLEELIILHAMGENLDAHRREDCPAGVMMIPIPRTGTLEKITGMERARAVEGIEDITMTSRPGQKLVPPPDGAQYLGFIFARADTPELVENALRRAHAELDITMD